MPQKATFSCNCELDLPLVTKTLGGSKSEIGRSQRLTLHYLGVDEKEVVCLIFYDLYLGLVLPWARASSQGCAGILVGFLQLRPFHSCHWMSLSIRDVSQCNLKREIHKKWYVDKRGMAC